MIVDGRCNDATVLALSHWPDSGTPAKYRADLSAEIVFNFLEDGDPTKAIFGGLPCQAASNNHFDEDGLVSLFSLLYPKLASDYKEILIDVAAAGDFGIFRQRNAARISFVLSAWATPELSPLNQSVFARPYPEVTAILYEELLVRLPNVIEKIDNLKRYWEEEDHFLTLSEAALDEGVVTIEECTDLDLAIVTVKRDDYPHAARVLGPSWVSNIIHPMAVHNRTERMKILLVKGRRYELYYRYETWVDYVSRPLIRRIDLSDLAAQLSALEKGAAHWQFNGNDEIISRLKLVGAETSAIDADRFLNELKNSLQSL
ncbi:MAG: hypothetical protein KGS72_12105 [Cyanobacteria bacterium REEB67]|nr:hypothetical protein [Cyanobacteria bacterium REEB67]